MRQTGVGLADKRLTIAIIVIPFINLGLSNTAAEINFGALAESIDIASGSADVGNIIIFLRTGFTGILNAFKLAVNVVDGCRKGTGHHRNLSADMETVALQALGRSNVFIASVLEFSLNVEAGSCASTFEVLSQYKGLGKAAVIIACLLYTSDAADD